MQRREVYRELFKDSSAEIAKAERQRAIVSLWAERNLGSIFAGHEKYTYALLVFQRGMNLRRGKPNIAYFFKDSYDAAIDLEARNISFGRGCEMVLNPKHLEELQLHESEILESRAEFVRSLRQAFELAV